jgi:hypothetical protein
MDRQDNYYTPTDETYDPILPPMEHDAADKMADDEAARVFRANSVLTDAQSLFTSRMEADPDVMAVPELRDRVEERALADLIEAENQALKIVTTAHEHLQAIYEQSAGTRYNLTTQEYAEASARQATIADDAERRSLSSLARDVQAAVFANDRAAMFAYLRAVPDRLKRESEKPGWDGVNAKREKNDLAELVTTIEGKLTHEPFKALHDKAGKALVEAGRVKRAAERRRIYDPKRAQSFGFMGPNDVPWNRVTEAPEGARADMR